MRRFGRLMRVTTHCWYAFGLRWAQIDPCEDRAIMLGRDVSRDEWDGTLWLLNLRNGVREHVSLSGEEPPRKDGGTVTIIPEQRCLLVGLQDEACSL